MTCNQQRLSQYHHEAKKGFIGDIYSTIHGIEGVLNKIINLRSETDETFETDKLRSRFSGYSISSNLTWMPS